MRFWSGWMESQEGLNRHLSGTSILLLHNIRPSDNCASTLISGVTNGVANKDRG